MIAVMKISSSEIHFNPWKHHLTFICNELLNLKRIAPEARLIMLDRIKAVNANFVDVYTGHFSEGEIKQSIADQLNHLEFKDYEGFRYWLGTKKYQLITLNDESVWVVRESEQFLNVIHIHPSRKPPLTFRIHGNALKTVVGLLCMQPDCQIKSPSLVSVNQLRKEFLDLSPVKGVGNLQRIMRFYDLVKNQLNILGETEPKY
ncbi:MAG: hypothetical protein Q8928_02410 [Bacteroidota bacterium]|nr:hypothetical protein [Bacteroidota bacterium]